MIPDDYSEGFAGDALRALHLVYSNFKMRSKTLLALTLLGSLAFAAEIPRKSPEFAVELPDGKQVLVSSYRGKVLCLVLIRST